VAIVYQLSHLLSTEQNEGFPEDLKKNGTGKKATDFEAFCRVHLVRLNMVMKKYQP
jgi:hypothetical protein